MHTPASALHAAGCSRVPAPPPTHHMRASRAPCGHGVSESANAVWVVLCGVARTGRVPSRARLAARLGGSDLRKSD
eukprot:3063703-Prymnesium_polylepis.1